MLNSRSLARSLTRSSVQVQMLSPVPTELSDTSEILEGSISADLSFHGSVATGSIASLRDPVDNRITVVSMRCSPWIGSCIKERLVRKIYCCC